MANNSEQGGMEIVQAPPRGPAVPFTQDCVDTIRVAAKEESEDPLRADGPSLKDFLKLLRKRRRSILYTLLLFFVGGWIYAYTTPNMYTATSTLEIRGYSPLVKGAELESLLLLDTRKATYQKTTTAKLTYLGIADKVLRQDDLAKDVAKYFEKRRSWFFYVRRFFKQKILGREISVGIKADGDSHYYYREQFLRNYVRMIRVRPVKDTTLVEVLVTTGEKVLSQRIANAHARGFIRQLTGERREDLSEHLKSLKAHANELTANLSSAEKNIARYAEEHGLVTLSQGNDDNLLVRQLGELNEFLTQATAQRIRSESLLKRVESEGEERYSAIDDESIRDLKTKLKEAEAEYAALSRMVTPEYPQMIELGGKIENLRAAIVKSRRQNVEALRTKYESNLVAEKKLVAQFEEQLKNAHGMAKEFVEYNLLVREAGSLRALTQSVLEELNETQISVASNKSNVFISDYAAVPRKASSPRRKVIVVFSLALGLFAGIGLAILREVLDSTIKVSDDAQTALGLPTLGIIPAFRGIDSPVGKKKVSRSLLPWRKYQRKGDEEGEVQHLPSKKHKFDTISRPRMSALDALRTLRANILFSSADNPSKLIMVTSSQEGEGKTSVVSNLAITFAKASQKTLLIDADLRHPKLGERFFIPPSQPGLVDVLAAQAEIGEFVAETGIENLWLIGAGSPTPTPTELLGSEKMSLLMQTFMKTYDVILIDCPPVLPVADSLMLAQVVDTVIFVVRSGKTDKGAAQEAIRRLHRVGAKVRGTVLNDFDPGEDGYPSGRYSVSGYGTRGRHGYTIIEVPSDKAVGQ